MTDTYLNEPDSPSFKEEMRELKEEEGINRAQAKRENPEPMNLRLVADMEFDGIDTKDYPDFCDAFIRRATYKGIECTEEQLEEINDNRDFVYDNLMNHLF